MSTYTNREFSWDFDALKHFYDTYVKPDAAPTSGSEMPVQSGGVWKYIHGHNYSEGAYLNGNGVVTNNTTREWAITSMITCQKGDTIEFSGGVVDTGKYMAVYDSSGTKLNVWNLSANPKTAVLSNDGIAFMLLSVNIAGISGAYVKVNGTYAWTPIQEAGLDGVDDYIADNTQTLQSRAVFQGLANLKLDTLGQNYREGGFWQNNNTLASNGSWCYSLDKIPVKLGDIVEVYTGTTNNSAMAIICDANGEKLESFAYNAAPRVFGIMKANASFIRFSFAKSYISTAYVKINGRVVWKPSATGEGLVGRIYNNHLFGGGSTPITRDFYGLIPNERYRLYNNKYDISSLAASSIILYVTSYNSSGTATQIAANTSDVVKEYNDFVVPSDSVYVRVTFRANANADIYFSIEKLPNNEIMPILSTNYSTIYKSVTGESESFLFYTDSHLFRGYSEMNIYNATRVLYGQIEDCANSSAISLVLDGGDWLNSHKQSIAIECLSLYHGWTRKMFGERYFPMFGNHDDNYQGELDETTSTTANDGALTTQQVQNIMFNEFGGLFYTFKKASTRWYILDSGNDHDNTMSAYRWGQIDWLANSLLQGNDEHIALGLHIVIDSTLQPFADNVTKVAQAYNAKTSITLNSQTYDFSAVTGTVHFAICGHTHAQSTTTANGIPVFVGNAAINNEFYLLIADYSAQKLRGVSALGNTIDMTIL